MVTQYNTVTVLVAKVYSSLRKKKNLFFFRFESDFSLLPRKGIKEEEVVFVCV